MPFDPSELTNLIACDVSFPQRACCIPLPGGLEVCILLPQVEATELEVLVQVFAQVNAALAPLGPIFNILDIVLAIVECIIAIPRSIALLNPGPVISCLQKLILALANILKLVPPFSLIFTVAAILDCLLLLMRALKRLAFDLVERQLRLIAAALQPVDSQAALLLQCELNNFNLLLASLNEYLKPLNRLLGLVNVFLSFFGQELPPFSSVSAGDLGGFGAAMDVAIATVDGIRDFIPVPRAT